MERRKDILGQNLENIWRQADNDYLPHRLGKKGQKFLIQDETKGWASRYVEIGKTDKWRSDMADTNPLIKIQTAIPILISRNPAVELTPSCSKYEESSAIQKQLYRRSWELAKSLQQLKLFVFNLIKYGWAVARTFPMLLENKGNVEFNGVFRENLDPWMTWIDDKTKPNDPLSIRDWAFAKWYSWTNLKKEFGKEKYFKFVEKGKSEELDTQYAKSVKKYVSKDLKLVFFYENIDDDVEQVLVDGIPIRERNLTLKDSNGNAKLSLWQTYWMLRHAEIPEGIGVAEAIHYSKNMLEKVKNMTVDQIVLSIYKMFFFEGTDNMEGDNKIVIAPGLGRQVTNPKDITWLEVPGAGKEAQWAVEAMQNIVDETSAITKPLTGEVIGKTAYESAQASEFSLRRLNTPLGNITDALEQDAQLTMLANEIIYSTPEIIKITDPDLIRRYYEEIQGDANLYEYDEQDNFYAKIYPEVRMNLDEDEQGRLIESEDAQFFRVKPKGLKWEGMITVKGQSLLVETKTLMKEMTKEIFGIITPLFQLPKELFLKPIKQLLKKYDFDWREWVPDEWLIEQPQQQSPQSLFVSQNQGQQGQPANNMALPTVLPRNEMGVSKSNAVNKLGGVLNKPTMMMGK